MYFTSKTFSTKYLPNFKIQTHTGYKNYTTNRNNWQHYSQIFHNFKLKHNILNCSVYQTVYESILSTLVYKYFPSQPNTCIHNGHLYISSCGFKRWQPRIVNGSHGVGEEITVYKKGCNGSCNYAVVINIVYAQRYWVAIQCLALLIMGQIQVGALR